MIEDLSIDPLPGQRSILHGFLGVTGAPELRGTVSYTARRGVHVTALRLRLRGGLRTALACADGAYAADSDLVVSSVDLIGGGGACGPSREELAGGGCSFEFRIAIPAALAASLPASFKHTLPSSSSDASHRDTPYKDPSFETQRDKDDETQRPGWNGAVIAYVLTAQLEFAASSSRQGVVAAAEEVDFPRIDPLLVARAVHTNTGKLMRGADRRLAYAFEIDRSIFSVGQPIVVSIHSILPVGADGHLDSNGHDAAISTNASTASSRSNAFDRTSAPTITSVFVSLVQVERIRAFRPGIRAANPEFDRLPKFKQRVVRTVLQSVELRRPSAGIKHLVNRMRRRAEPWSGRASILIQSTRIRLRNDSRFKAVDVFKSFDSDFISVAHHIEIRVKLSDSPDPVVYSIPVQFMDIDLETRDWVLRNADVFNNDAADFDDDARSGYIFLEDEYPP